MPKPQFSADVLKETIVRECKELSDPLNWPMVYHHIAEEKLKHLRDLINDYLHARRYHGKTGKP